MNKPLDVYINTPLGHKLSLTVFKPKTSIKKSIVISSATGVLQHYYYKFATHFSELGYTVFSFDYSGIGKSNSSIKDLKRSTIDIKDWGENDQTAVSAYAKSQNPQHKLIMVTHSIGGQILGFNKNISQVDALITVASQSGYWKYWKGFERIKMYLFWHILIPTLTPLFGYFPAKKLKLFENLPKRMVYQWAHWGKHKDYILSEFNSEKLHFKNYNKHLLSLSFPKDEYASKIAVDWLANQFINAKLDRRHIVPKDLGIQNIGHFGFFRSKFKNSLWKMTHLWIEEHS